MLFFCVLIQADTEATKPDLRRVAYTRLESKDKKMGKLEVFMYTLMHASDWVTKNG